MHYSTYYIGDRKRDPTLENYRFKFLMIPMPGPGDPGSVARREELVEAVVVPSYGSGLRGLGFSEGRMAVFRASFRAAGRCFKDTSRRKPL